MPIKSKKQASYLKRNKPSVYRKLANPKYKKKTKPYKKKKKKHLKEWRLYINII